MSDKTREDIAYERGIIEAEVLQSNKVQARLLARLNNSIRVVTAGFEKFGNPIGMLTNSLNKMDSTNRDALKIGVTNKKLSNMVSKNSSVLSDNLVSNQALQEAIIQNFGQGVRFQTEGLMNLTTEMIATGQDVQSLGNLNSDLALATDNSADVVTRLAEVNKEVSDKYGVSNDKLINTLQTLKSSLDKASFFGDEAVESLGVAAQELKGRAGGTNIDGALATMSELLVGGLDTIKAASVLGIQGDRESIAGGGGITADRIAEIADEFKRVSDSFGGGSLDLDYTAQLFEMSKAQVAGMLQLAKVAHNDSGIQEGLKKTTDETYNTIENVNARAANFYDKTAMGMLGFLGAIPIGIVGSTTQIVAAIGGIGGPIAANRQSREDEVRHATEEREKAARRNGTSQSVKPKSTPDPFTGKPGNAQQRGTSQGTGASFKLDSNLREDRKTRIAAARRKQETYLGRTTRKFIPSPTERKSFFTNRGDGGMFGDKTSKFGRSMRGGAAGIALGAGLNAVGGLIPGMNKEDGTSKFSGASTGLSIGLGVAPFLGPFSPLAIGIGGAVGLLTDLVSWSDEDAKRAEEEKKARKRKEAEDKAKKATKEMQNANIFAGYIRRSIDLSYGPEMINEMKNISVAVRKGPKSNLTRSTAQNK
tara:strand:- start:4836 stop:6782 length:1947 start_codon:yes stop_codon:yes gene_type:complete